MIRIQAKKFKVWITPQGDYGHISVNRVANKSYPWMEGETQIAIYTSTTPQLHNNTISKEELLFYYKSRGYNVVNKAEEATLATWELVEVELTFPDKLVSQNYKQPEDRIDNPHHYSNRQD